MIDPVPSVTKLLGRRAGPLGLALTAYDLWRRIPPKQRAQLAKQMRKHGPRVARQLIERGAAARRR